MLGYGGGTAAGLIRLFYGDVPITAVDIDDCSHLNYYNVELIEADAQEFVKTCGKYDAVLVDIYNEAEYNSPQFVFSKEFADNLKRIANYLIIHAVVGDDMSAYDDLYKVRELSTNAGGPYEPRIHYYMVKDVPIPVR